MTNDGKDSVDSLCEGFLEVPYSIIAYNCEQGLTDGYLFQIFGPKSDKSPPSSVQSVPERSSLHFSMTKSFENSQKPLAIPYGIGYNK